MKIKRYLQKGFQHIVAQVKEKPQARQFAIQIPIFIKKTAGRAVLRAPFWGFVDKFLLSACKLKGHIFPLALGCPSQYICQKSKLFMPVFCIFEQLKIGLWIVWAEQHTRYTRFLPTPSRKEMNVPKLNSSQELNVLICIL